VHEFCVNVRQHEPERTESWGLPGSKACPAHAGAGMSRVEWATELRRGRNMWRGLASLTARPWTPELIRLRNDAVRLEAEKRLGPPPGKSSL
jgi:hypothetical protein